LNISIENNAEINNCYFKADVITINVYGNNNNLDNDEFKCNHTEQFVKISPGLKGNPYNNEINNPTFITRFSIKDYCCVCESPITMDDVIINLKDSNYCLCKACSDLYLANLLVVMKL
jgi:hypothetical protein